MVLHNQKKLLILSLYDKSKFTSLMKETFGAYIRELRMNNNLTLTQLAAKLNMDSANLSKVENNKRVFDFKKLYLLAEIFNIDLTKLKIEFFSYQIAEKLYENNCSNETLSLAEEKLEYIRQKRAKQGNLKILK